MKNHLFASIFAWFATAVAAQTPNIIYMFDKYQDGTAVIKPAGIQQGKFNYDLISGKILFMDGEGKELVLANPGVISSVEFGSRVFMHVSGDIFYEKIALPDNRAYYVRWRSNKLSKGKISGHGTSTTASIGHMTSMYDMSSTGYDLTSGEEYKLKPANAYYLWINGRYRQFSNAKQLGQLFSGHESEISDFAQKEGINFELPADVAKIMEYCVQFIDSDS